MTRIEGVRAKIERAEKHIFDLETLVFDFLGTDFYTLRTKNKPEIAHTTFYVASVQPLPKDVPFILGDALHNLRSSLDHLAWQLVDASGGNPGKIEFPITKCRQQYQSAFGKREITQMRKEAVDLIRSIQPYRTTDLTLWYLHQLDIMDKHKLVVPVACALGQWGLKNPDIWLGDLSSSFYIEVGEELLTIPNDKTHDNIKFATNIAFRDSEIAGFKPVFETLYGMRDAISSMLPDFEPFLL